MPLSNMDAQSCEPLTFRNFIFFLSDENKNTGWKYSQRGSFVYIFVKSLEKLLETPQKALSFAKGVEGFKAEITLDDSWLNIQ